jgi:hypothetical protein
MGGKITIDSMSDQLMDYVDNCSLEDLIELYNDVFSFSIIIEDVDNGE